MVKLGNSQIVLEFSVCRYGFGVCNCVSALRLTTTTVAATIIFAISRPLPIQLQCAIDVWRWRRTAVNSNVVHRENCVKMPVAFVCSIRFSVCAVRQTTVHPLCRVYHDNAMVYYSIPHRMRSIWHVTRCTSNIFTDTENSQTVISHFHIFSSIRTERKVSSGMSVHKNTRNIATKKTTTAKYNQIFRVQFNWPDFNIFQSLSALSAIFEWPF